MSAKTKFNIDNYIEETINDLYGPTIIVTTPQQQEFIASEKIRVKTELKQRIETDYAFCKDFCENYSNFVEIVDSLGATIVNTPQLELYRTCIEESNIESWKNSNTVENQALYWQYYLRNNAEDKISQQHLYERQRDLLIEDLDESFETGTGDQAFINTLIDGLDKAAEMLGLETYNVTNKGTSVPDVPTPVLEKVKDDTTSSEEQEKLEDKPLESVEPEYIIEKSIDSSGNETETVYKLYHEFTKENMEDFLDKNQVQNWKECTNNPAKDFQPGIPIPDPASKQVSKDLFTKLSQYICEKLKKDIKEQCGLVLDNIETKSDEKGGN